MAVMGSTEKKKNFNFVGYPETTLKEHLDQKNYMSGQAYFTKYDEIAFPINLHSY
jgi:hypothetical protein